MSGAACMPWSPNSTTCLTASSSPDCLRHSRPVAPVPSPVPTVHITVISRRLIHPQSRPTWAVRLLSRLPLPTRLPRLLSSTPPSVPHGYITDTVLQVRVFPTLLTRCRVGYTALQAPILTGRGGLGRRGYVEPDR